MVVKVFCGKKSKFDHELNQLEELHNLIKYEYAKKDDLIYILTNFRLSNAEIDVLVLTERGLAIIDLKSYEGEIKGSETGEWKVITKNGDVVPFKDNLFDKLQEKRAALRRKLFRIQEAGNFEHIEGDFLSRISGWYYFKKGSTYDLKQVDGAVHCWFDVITADKLLRKIIFLNAGYELKQEDMNAIVEGLNLKPYSFEKYAPTITQPSESLANTEELLTPKKEDIFEKVKPQIVHASQAIYVEERMHGDVLEHRHPHPPYNFWHPIAESHADADERMFDGVLYHMHSRYYDYWHLPSEKHDEEERICRGISEHKHRGYDYWHPVSENHETLAKIEYHEVNWSNVEERRNGDVLEHKHPEYDYWHPASRPHKLEVAR